MHNDLPGDQPTRFDGSFDTGALEGVTDVEGEVVDAKLLDVAAGGNPVVRTHLEALAKSMTFIGNGLQIRHSETNKEPVAEVDHVTFLFFQLYGLIHLILSKTGRLAK